MSRDIVSATGCFALLEHERCGCHLQELLTFFERETRTPNKQTVCVD